MRTVLSLLVLTLAGCTSARPGVVPVVPQDTGESALAFRLARGTSEFGPVLRVTVANRTQRAVCVRAEALRNPRTQEMLLYLRNAHGRELRWQNPGIIPPPMEGIVRIEAGSSAEGSYYLRGRFMLPDDWEPLPHGWHARAAVRYGPCENATSHWAASAWQPL
jgi:hypothetical protein